MSRASVRGITPRARTSAHRVCLKRSSAIHDKVDAHGPDRADRASMRDDSSSRAMNRSRSQRCRSPDVLAATVCHRPLRLRAIRPLGPPTRHRRGGRVGRRGAVGGGRRMHRVEGLSAREISRRTGLHRETVAQAVGGGGAAEVSSGSRPGRSSIRSRTGSASSSQADPRIQSQRLREMATRDRL